jgi:hypothetical protein
MLLSKLLDELEGQLELYGDRNVALELESGGTGTGRERRTLTASGELFVTYYKSQCRFVISGDNDEARETVDP